MVLPILQQMKISEATKVTLLLEASLGDVLAVLTAESLIDLMAAVRCTACYPLWRAKSAFH